MMPLGLHHLFAGDHHYGPGPWYAPRGIREDWTPKYYHKADSTGIGFDRSHKGSNAVEQYQEPLRSLFDNPATCPESLLLWFHHVPWTYRMKNGNTLWDELCRTYDRGVREVRDYRETWEQVQPYVDDVGLPRFSVPSAVRNWTLGCEGCLYLVFRQFSRLPVPGDVEPPAYDLGFLIKPI